MTMPWRRSVSSSPMANRVLVVGWDGADWDILDPLLAAGELPALQELIVRGQRGVSRSCLRRTRGRPGRPSPTGQNPGGHGVFDIRVPAGSDPAGCRSRTARSSPDLARSPLRRPGGDAAPERAAHLSRRRRSAASPAGGVVPRAGRSATRRTWGPGSTGRSTAGPGRRWAIGRSSRRRSRGAHPQARSGDATLLDEEPWDAACVVSFSPDRLQHCLLEYVHPGTSPTRRWQPRPSPSAFATCTDFLDRELATLVERTGDGDLVVLMSDHGHQPCTRASP